jgi:uncharacterized protein DUF6010
MPQGVSTLDNSTTGRAIMSPCITASARLERGTMTVTAFSFPHIGGALTIALVWIAAFSLLREPKRQKLSAIMISGAGAAYLGGGLGMWEFLACAVFTAIAYKGLADYRFIGVGWFLHTCWDLVHHFYGHPIIPFAPNSSAGCAICDLALACWYFTGARSLFGLFRVPARREG